MKSRNKIEDADVLLEEINKYLVEGGDKRTFEPHQLDDLLNGASMSSAEAETDEEGFTVYDTFIDEESDISDKVEKAETMSRLLIAIDSLEMIEKKLIKLKGVDL